MEKTRKRKDRKETIIFYGLPALGHIHSNLYLASCLSILGFQVIYYSMMPFKNEIEANGCIFRPYPLKENSVDLSDGNKLIKLYRLILTYTMDMLPSLLYQARKDKPSYIIFDSLALWGRAVGKLLSVPTSSFYSIVAINRVVGKAFWSYASGFFTDSLHYLWELPQAIHWKHQLKHTYGIKNLGLLDVLMNKGDWNLMGYSKSFQPGGQGFGDDYVFLGPLCPLRTVPITNDFNCPEGKLIYISLGTIFNQDEELLREVISQLGEKEHPSFQVVMVWNLDKALGNLADVKEELKQIKNFIIRPYVNQGEILKQADLFISAGGMNSIHEALYYGVPCLLCPQQGEQLINARTFEKKGFGRILQSKASLLSEALTAMSLKHSWNEEARNEMLKVHVDEALKLYKRKGGTD